MKNNAAQQLRSAPGAGAQLPLPSPRQLPPGAVFVQRAAAKTQSAPVAVEQKIRKQFVPAHPQNIQSQQTTNKPAEDNNSKLKLLALGDSITEGYNLGFVTSPDLWVNKLADKLLQQTPGVLGPVSEVEIVNAGNSGAISTVVLGEQPPSILPGHARKIRVVRRGGGATPSIVMDHSYRAECGSPRESLLAQITSSLSQQQEQEPEGSSRVDLRRANKEVLPFFLTTVFFGTNEVGGYKLRDAESVTTLALSVVRLAAAAMAFSQHVVVILPFVERHASLGQIAPDFFQMYKGVILRKVAGLSDEYSGRIGVVDLNDEAAGFVKEGISLFSWALNWVFHPSKFGADPLAFYTLKDPSGTYAYDRLHPDGNGH
eukprot:g14820.t1